MLENGELWCRKKQIAGGRARRSLMAEAEISSIVRYLEEEDPKLAAPIDGATLVKIQGNNIQVLRVQLIFNTIFSLFEMITHF